MKILLDSSLSKLVSRFNLVTNSSQINFSNKTNIDDISQNNFNVILVDEHNFHNLENSELQSELIKKFPLLLISEKRLNNTIYSEIPISLPITNLNEFTLNQFLQLALDKFKFDKEYKAVVSQKSIYENNCKSGNETIDNLSVGIYEINEDGSFQNANTKFLELIGVESFSQLKSINAFESSLFPNGRRRLLRSMLDENIIVSNFENKWIRGDNKKTLTFSETIRFKNSNGKGKIYQSVITDITEYVQSQELISLRTKFWKLSFQYSIKDLMTTILDEICELTNSPIGFYHFVNPDNSVSLKAWSSKSLIEYSEIKDLKHNYSLEEAGIWADCIRNKNAAIHNDYEEIKSKKYILEDLNSFTREMIVPIIDNDNVVAILGVGNNSVDYTECDFNKLQYLAEITGTIVSRKKYEENLLKQSKIISTTTLSILVTDPEGNIEYVNSAFTKNTGFESDEVLGKNPRLLNGGKNSDEFYKYLWETIKKGTTWNGIFHNKKKNGDFFWEETTISPILNSIGEIVNYVAIKTDVTDKKNLEQELLDSKYEAEKSDRLKSEFLTQISHEIRTPVNTLLNYSALIKEEFTEHISEESEQYFGAMQSAGSRIIRTIDLIIKMSELHSDNYVPEFKETCIIEVLEELIEKYKPEAEKKGLDLSLIKSLSSSFVFVDRLTIIDVFYNIIDNAIKYTHKGFVKVYVKKSLFNKINVIIKDSGVGIASDYLANIFEPFSQETNGYTRKFDGNGLGLTLVREYCKLNNAEIFVNSEKNSGSEFHISFK